MKLREKGYVSHFKVRPDEWKILEGWKYLNNIDLVNLIANISDLIGAKHWSEVLPVDYMVSTKNARERQELTLIVWYLEDTSYLKVSHWQILVLYYRGIKPDVGHNEGAREADIELKF